VRLRAALLKEKQKRGGLPSLALPAAPAQAALEDVKNDKDDKSDASSSSSDESTEGDAEKEKSGDEDMEETILNHRLYQELSQEYDLKEAENETLRSEAATARVKILDLSRQNRRLKDILREVAPSVTLPRSRSRSRSSSYVEGSDSE